MQTNTLLMTIILLASTMLSACSQVTENSIPASSSDIDYVFTNARVYTVNKKQPWAEAVVVDDNTIVYVGDTKTAFTYVTDHNAGH